jgi:hypothetical protein
MLCLFTRVSDWVFAYALAQYIWVGQLDKNLDLKADRKKNNYLLSSPESYWYCTEGLVSMT